MILQLRQLSKKYGTQQAVDSVNFSIEKGEIVGFLGPNGAGKTTTMKIITGSIPADEGEVIVGNYEMSREPLKVKSLIGYLPENNPLYEDMYVAEYLEYVAGIYLKGEVRERVRETIAQTGLLPEVHKKIGQLSKGYRQRVGLAQAMIHRPELLILDEPSSGLDPLQIDEINRLLLSLSPDRAILFSSHTLSEVSAICTRILIIHRGKIVADRPAGEIEDLGKLFRELTSS